MKRKLMIIGIAFLVLLVGFLIYVAMQPGNFAVARSATISAPAEKIFPMINDFHNWTQWSPWENMDPELKRTYEGPTSGVGTSYAWTGNDKVGTGRMTITESKPNESIVLKLEFKKPFEATNQTVFKLTPAGSDTKVDWVMTGECNFFVKGMMVFMGSKCMDKMVGGDFEKGLATMKSVAESKK